MLAWLIGITDINPFHYDLLFERFLNPARISMPDFDIDFEDTLRDKVVDYVTEKYGSDNVCAIGTYMKLSTKAAFKDLARTMGIPFDRSNLVSNLLPDNISLKHINNDNPDISDELKQLIENDKIVSNEQISNEISDN
jgi:DNA polymerase-3 subunit alpha